MEWKDIRQHYPEQWVLIEALEPVSRRRLSRESVLLRNVIEPVTTGSPDSKRRFIMQPEHQAKQIPLFLVRAGLYGRHKVRDLVTRDETACRLALRLPNLRMC